MRRGASQSLCSLQKHGINDRTVCDPNSIDLSEENVCDLY